MATDLTSTSLKSQSYKGIYAMHKYWGKKPFNLISHFITKYTEPGDIVLDPFCGSGVTAIEAIRNNRRAITLDINPIATLLTNVSLTITPIDLINNEFNQMKTKLQPLINSLYYHPCPNCGKNSLVTHTIWNRDTPVEVWYRCDCSKKKQIRLPDDLDISQSNNPSLEPLWYPTTPMFKNSRINVSDNQNVSDLFTARALVSLSYIRDYIDHIENVDVKNTMEIVLTGTLSQASKLVFVIRNRKNSKNEDKGAEVGSWVAGYWVPEEHFEINVWNCFENRFKRVLKGKQEINTLFSSSPILFDDINTGFSKNFDGIIELGSATELHLEDNSVDYVFTDPPHVNRILYLEMSLMWNSWLKIEDIDWNDEIVVSEAKQRNKNETNYSELLSKSLAEVSRVLKKDKVFSIAYNSLDDQNWKSLLDVCSYNGFKFKNIIPLEYSATSVVQDNRKNALKTDFVISFYNTKSKTPEIVMNCDISDASRKITDILNEDMETYEVINEMMITYMPSGVFYSPNTIIQALEKSENIEYVNGKWHLIT